MQEIKEHIVDQLQLVEDLRLLIEKQLSENFTIKDNWEIREKIKNLASHLFLHDDNSPVFIKKTVQSYFNVDLNSKSRKTRLNWIRQSAFYFACETCKDYTLQMIGEQMAGKTHATVLHARKQVQNRIDTNDREFLKIFNQVKNLMGL